MFSIVVIYFWQPSQLSFLNDLVTIEAMLIFALSGLVISGVTELMIRSRAQLKIFQHTEKFKQLQFEQSQQSEQQLQASQQKFHDLFEKSPAATVLINLKNGMITDANTQALILFGAELSTLKQRAFYDIVDIEDRATVKTLCQHIAKTQLSEMSDEQRFVRANGERIWVQLNLGCIENKAGKVEMLIGSFIDISKQKMAQNKLKEQNELLTEMSAMAHVGGWGFDPVTGEGAWTEETARIHDVNPNDKTNRVFGLSFYHGEHKQKIEAAVNAAIESGIPYDLELELISAKDKHKWIRTIGHPTMEDGKVVQVRGAIQDITERKALEDALVKRMAYFRAAIDATSAGVVVINDQGRIVEVNQGYTASSGYSREELLQMHITDLETIESEAETQAHMAKILSVGYDRFETIHRTKSGRSWPIEADVNHVSSVDNLFFAFIIDISDRKANEAKITDYVSQLEAAMKGTLTVISKMVEQRDPYTAGHECRVGKIAADIAREMGWKEEKCQSLELIGMVHDIGKIGVPSEILTKPGRLTALEYQMVQTHAERGYQILKDVRFPIPIAEIIRQHHEHLDGSGYPRGLKADAILPEARILTVADVLESMASHRPYREALGVKVALAEIIAHRNVYYDTDAVDALIRLIEEKNYRLPECHTQ